MKKISIVIRTKNEEAWIGKCLGMVFNQNYKNFEVIIVDNNSTDHTVEIAKRYKINKIITIDNFKPGKALNLGIKEAEGFYVVCLSAHCIPKDNYWLDNLVKNFKENDNLAGVYGRQLPLSFTKPIDKRDLLIVFGQDKRIQKKDYFFHNANSIIPRAILEKYSFDETVSNIEDRVWGKKVISDKFQIIYEPDAAVYHYHGLHKENETNRAKGVASIINKVDAETFEDLPKILKPEEINVAAVIPVEINLKNNSKYYDIFLKTIEDLKKSEYLKRIYIVSNEKEIVSKNDYWINRKEINNNQNIDLNLLMKNILNKIEEQNYFPDLLTYINYQYINRPENIYDKLIFDAQHMGYDTVFPAYTEYNQMWLKKDDDNYEPFNVSNKPSFEREPIFRALYGLGCVTSSSVLRTGKMVGGKVGIYPLNEWKFTYRDRPEKAEI